MASVKFLVFAALVACVAAASIGNEEVKRVRRYGASFGGAQASAGAGGYNVGFVPFGGSQASAQASANAGSFGGYPGGFGGANAAASAQAGAGGFGYGR